MELSLLARFAIALGLGLLVGFERERAESSVAGLRTFALITLLGALSTAIAAAHGGWVVAAALLGASALLVTGNFLKLHAGTADPGMTTEFAALVMFGVGALLAIGRLPQAVVLSGTVAVLLHWKAPLHGVVRGLAYDEVRAIMRLALIALVVLPLLPNRAYGPYGVLNPFAIWLMVVLIVGISLAAYIASKLLGARVGTLLGGALGGLISSTAATVSYARRTRGAAEAVDGAAIMIVIASTIVFVRVLFEVAVVAPEVLTAVAAPLGVVLALLGAIAAASYARARRALRPPAHIGAPSDLRAAIVFGGLYAAVLFAVALAKEHLGERGLFAVAALSGLTDVDAITLSTAQLLKAGRLDLDTGWRLILTGALANLVFKAAAVAVLGHRRLFARIALQFGIALAGGAAVLAFWPA
jgi:uncharacterized membrane protein (DUF4010 family)